MPKERSRNTLTLIVCIGLIGVFGVLGSVYTQFDHLEKKGEKKMLPVFYTVTRVESTIAVGGKGYYIDVDVAFLSGDKKAEESLRQQESRLKDIAITSMSDADYDIRTPTGKKEIQREILRQVRDVEPKVSEVLFPNLLMVPVYAVN